MTKAELWEVIKTCVVIVYGVLLLLSTFGPLQQYWQWFGLGAGIVAIVAAALGVQLTRPTVQVSDIKERKAGGSE
jgi:hypothetical protein